MLEKGLENKKRKCFKLNWIYGIMIVVMTAKSIKLMALSSPERKLQSPS